MFAATAGVVAVALTANVRVINTPYILHNCHSKQSARTELLHGEPCLAGGTDCKNDANETSVVATLCNFGLVSLTATGRLVLLVLLFFFLVENLKQVFVVHLTST